MKPLMQAAASSSLPQHRFQSSDWPQEPPVTLRPCCDWSASQHLPLSHWRVWRIHFKGGGAACCDALKHSAPPSSFPQTAACGGLPLRHILVSPPHCPEDGSSLCVRRWQSVGGGTQGFTWIPVHERFSQRGRTAVSLSCRCTVFLNEYRGESDGGETPDHPFWDL